MGPGNRVVSSMLGNIADLGVELEEGVVWEAEGLQMGYNSIEPTF